MNSLIGAVAAAGAAACFGAADFAGGSVSRRLSPLSASFLVQAVGVVSLGGILVWLAAPIRPSAVGVGATAGVAAATGLFALYAAISRAPMGAVAALTGITASAVAMTFDVVLDGLVPSILQALGLGCALVGGLLSTGLARVSVAAGSLSVVAGIGFAASFIAFDAARDENSVAVLFVARLVAAGLFLGGLLVPGQDRRLDIGPTIIFAGILDTAANLLMLAAVTLIPVAFATAIATAYPPIVTLLLARCFLGERLPRAGYLAVGVACLGIALIVLG